MKISPSIQIGLATSLVALGLAVSQVQEEKPPPVIEGVKGVEQEAVESVKKVEPPVVVPVPESNALGVEKVDGINTIDGVKTPAPNSVTPVTPPPPVGAAVSSIRAVKGVQGIVVPKQRNLEAALLIEAGTGPDGPAAAAAAAGLFGSPGIEPGLPGLEDGRVDFQEFEKQNTPGS
jgi:hypothetical protein